MKSKEERVKCEENYKNEWKNTRGNIGIKFRNTMCENRISEVMKKTDITRSVE